MTTAKLPYEDLERLLIEAETCLWNASMMLRGDYERDPYADAVLEERQRLLKRMVKRLKWELRDQMERAHYHYLEDPGMPETLADRGVL